MTPSRAWPRPARRRPNWSSPATSRAQHPPGRGRPRHFTSQG
jgi:hypothetical protein